MRVVFVSEVPTAYRTPLFLRLSELVDLHVLYCSPADPWRGTDRQDVSSHGEILTGLALGGRRGGVSWKVNPSVWRRLSALAPDALVISGYAHPTMQLAMIWARRRRVPYVLHSESNDLNPRPLWRRAAKAYFVSWAIKGAAAFLPVSSSAAAYLRRRGATKPMFILANAPDVERIAEISDKTFREERDAPAFLFVGRLVAAKDPDTLLRAFARARGSLPDATLHVVGEGPLEPQLRATCMRESIEEVVFHGFVKQDDLISYLVASDCFVLPSLYEPYGVVVLEAMAAGLPVILSDRVGSASDLVMPGENGFVVPAGDHVALAARMVDVIKDGHAERFGERSRELAMTWTYERGAESVLSALHAAGPGRP